MVATAAERPRARRRLALTLCGALGAFVVINAAASAFLERRSANLGYSLIRTKWAMLLSLKKPVDWLILGDSSGNQGVIPEILEAKVGGSALNLCTIADMLTVDDAWMLETYLSRFGAPKAVVLVHVYDLWRREPNLSVLAQAPLGWRARRRLEPRIGLSFRQELDWWLNHNAVLYAENVTLSTLLKDPRLLFTHPRPLPKIGLSGFMAVTAANPARVEEQREGHAQFVRQNKFRVSELNRLGLEEILALADKYDFDVYFAQSPLYEGLYRDEGFREYFDQVQRMLGAYALRNPRFHLVFHAPILFRKDQMENADHVIESAARDYTSRLASQLGDPSGIVKKSRPTP